jgi:hypothetical protein
MPIFSKTSTRAEATLRSTATILEMSFLTMTLMHHHVHTVSKNHNIYSLDFHWASGIWCVLKDLSRTNHKAANPTVDPFESLPHYINPHHLSKIGIATPQILMIKKYSQNMLLSTTLIDQVFSWHKQLVWMLFIG